MGEHNTLSWVRAGGAAAVSVAAVVALSSCSLLQIAPSPAATSSPQQTEVIDPSIPVPTPSATDTGTGAPQPSLTAPARPTASATATATASAGKHTVTPFISAAVWDGGSGVLDVVALVPNLVELGGTCTVTATSGGHTVRASATASPGANDTECNPVELPGSRLAVGTWTVTVTYSSTKSFGVSTARTVQVTK